MHTQRKSFYLKSHNKFAFLTNEVGGRGEGGGGR